VPLVIGGGMFVFAVPNVRNRTSLEFPWARQAMLGLGASALGLALSAYAGTSR